MKSTIIGTLAAATIIAAAPNIAAASPTAGTLTLSYSDGRPATDQVGEINDVLRAIGVHVSSINLPPAAMPIIKAAKKRALKEDETQQLLSLFSLDRSELLDQVRLAGRKPAVAGGGHLAASEIGIAPYPKVYDMKAMSREGVLKAQEKFGKLHVNSTDAGEGIDEVMTVLSGNPWTWFFRLPDGVVAKLSLDIREKNEQGWRISYSGLVPHAAFLNAHHGLTVAHAYGAEHFVMRYQQNGIEGADLLGKNPWIDFSGTAPVLKK